MDFSKNSIFVHIFVFDLCPPLYDVSYWDFGDGQYSSNPNTEHKFLHYGSFNVTLRVSNTAGQTNSVTHTIVVGHYSLDKVIYTKTSTHFSVPFQLQLLVIYTPPSPPYW